MGIHYDYKSTKSAKLMEKQAKREKKLAEKKAKRLSKEEKNLFYMTVPLTQTEISTWEQLLIKFLKI